MLSDGDGDVSPFLVVSSCRVGVKCTLGDSEVLRTPFKMWSADLRCED
jgi:hypothetical protein